MVSQVEYTTFVYINTFRQHENISRLDIDLILSEVARNYSKLMAKKQFFSHYYEGKSVVERVGDYGYFALGENLAEIPGECYDIEIASKAVELWANSPSHRYVMSGKEFDKVGVGIYCENNRNYITTIYAQTCFTQNITLLSERVVVIVPKPQPNTSKVISINATADCEFKLYVFPVEEQENYFFYEEPKHVFVKKYDLPIAIALQSPFDCEVQLTLCYLNDLE
ncbi:MAG: CAP domain-containing protein [Candidatus Micrarchaeota archaeon]|nr:CAP domain-containing protein [Candidatus Micrarchaeota archaeon]